MGPISPCGPAHGTCPLAASPGTCRRALILTSPKRVQTGLGFLCDCPGHVATEISSLLLLSSWVTLYQLSRSLVPICLLRRHWFPGPLAALGLGLEDYSHSQKIAPQAQTPDTSRGEVGGTGSERKWTWTLKTSNVSFKPNSTWCVEIGVAGPSVESSLRCYYGFPNTAGLLTTLTRAGPWSGILSPPYSPPWTLLIATRPFLIESHVT